MGSTSETKKNNNEKINDSISISSMEDKLNVDNTYSNKDYINNNPLSNIQSDTRDTTKISEIKDETFPYKFIWNAGGKIVKIAGTFLDNWKKAKEMKKNINSGNFEIVINLTKSKHEFKFIVDNKWLCSRQYEIIQDKDNYNNILDLTNYSPNIEFSQDSQQTIRKRARKLSTEYGCIYVKNSDLEREVPTLPSYFAKRFDINNKSNQKYLNGNSKSFVASNLNKKILINKEYKAISNISHEKLLHFYYETEKDYNNNNYIKSAITQRNNHKFLTFIYYSPKVNK